MEHRTPGKIPRGAVDHHKLSLMDKLTPLVQEDRGEEKVKEESLRGPRQVKVKYQQGIQNGEGQQRMVCKGLLGELVSGERNQKWGQAARKKAKMKKKQKINK